MPPKSFPVNFQTLCVINRIPLKIDGERISKFLYRSVYNTCSGMSTILVLVKIIQSRSTRPSLDT